MQKLRKFIYNKNYLLESGEFLPGFQIAYTTYGNLNPRKDNVVWICHALTANSDFTDWWRGLFGRGKLFDPDKHFVICANILGSCYGSTGPLSINPFTDLPYYHNFPKLTNRDIVGSFDLLRQHLGISKIQTLIGGSLGGQHALEWAIMRPENIENLVQIASNAKHSPWGIAFNETQRMAIQQDITWNLSTDKAGLNGLKAARAIALLSYRNYSTYKETQADEDDEIVSNFRAATYQQYQGKKLAKRFNAFTYWRLTEAMDTHNVGRGRGGVEKALQQIKAKCLFLGVQSDLLFPVEEQEYLAANVPGAELQIIESLYGHDGFLVEAEKLTQCLRKFYNFLHSAPVE